MSQVESSTFPDTRRPQFWSPSRASWKTFPVLHFTVEFLPRTRERHVDWDHVLGLAVLVGGSVLAWASMGLELSRLLR